MKYKVLRPIEHDQKLYLPDGAPAVEKARSAGNGQEIPVDASGVIELEERQARLLPEGRVEPSKNSAGGRKVTQ